MRVARDNIQQFSGVMTHRCITQSDSLRNRYSFGEYYLYYMDYLLWINASY